MNKNQNILLHAQNLHKSFIKNKSEIKILNGIDLSIQAGEQIAIVGASGTGKSTLLHVLGTLEKPSIGKLIFSQNEKVFDLTQFQDEKISLFRNKSLGFVFQFHYLLPEFSALENVMMPSLIAGESFSKSQKRASDILKWIGLEARMEHRPAELSGGEQQRVAIARAVILQPKIIFADEPTGNLDSKNKEIIMELFSKLHDETGVSIVMVTHDFDLAKRMNRVLEMKDGKLV